MKNLNINLGKMLSLRGVSLVLAGSLLMGGLAGCSSTLTCDISITHAHMFVNEDGYARYVICEKSTWEGYKKSYNTIRLSDDEVELYDFLEKKDLLRIDDNLDLVLAQQEANKPFMAYEYSVYHFVRAGSPYSFHWTNNPEHENLTGKEKAVHYIYQAYKVEKNENGGYVLIPSDIVEDITEVMDEYPYMRVDYYKSVDEHNVGVEISDFVVLEDEVEPDNSDSDKLLKKVME